MKTYFTLILLSFTFLTVTSQVKSFRTNLYIVPDGGDAPVLMDGTLTMFDNNYSNAVDNKDARKMFNPGENWGMQRDPYVLIVERRQDISIADTIFFKVWNTRIITYRLEMIPKNFPSNRLSASLIDKYLGTETPVSLTENGYADFKVTADAGSKRSDRFMLVFNGGAAEGMLPLNFISSNASVHNKSVDLQWETANEHNVSEYVIEKSADGTQFTKTSLAAGAKNTPAASYSITDYQPYAGANYYRISAVDKDGRTTVSNVMKVSTTNIEAQMTLFPNPTNANNIRLKINGQAAGTYQVRLVNINGVNAHTQSFTLTTAATELRLAANKTFAPGIYRIEISGPDGYRNVLNLLIHY